MIKILPTVKEIVIGNRVYGAATAAACAFQQIMGNKMDASNDNADRPNRLSQFTFFHLLGDFTPDGQQSVGWR